MVLARTLPAGLSSRVTELIERGALPRRALHVMLETLRLTAAPPSARLEAIGLKEDGGPFGRRKDVRFLLVDDQYRLGFHHIVGHTIFGAHYQPDNAREQTDSWHYEGRLATLECVAAWDRLLDALSRCPPVAGDWAMPRRIAIPNCDVLLLDLRLWLKGQDERRRTFLIQLTEVADVLGARAISDPAFNHAYNAARSLADGSESSELAALALMPLLLSHYDSAFPIVLFSSTHQREVLGLVSHRPNIITTFSKPLLTGYGTMLVAEEGIPGLVAGLRRALELHEARVVWEKLPNASWTWNPPFRLGADVADRRMYNIPGNQEIPLQIQDEDLRSTLKQLYENYLLRDSYFDFASVPYELLEGWLTPIDAQQRGGNTGFDFVTGSVCEGGFRNAVARALQNIRNRKVHGKARWPESATEKDNWRIASLFTFMVFLDYVQGANVDMQWRELSKITNDIWNNLRTSYATALRQWAESYNAVRVQRLTAIQDFPWLPFVVYAVTQAARNSVDQCREPQIAWLSHRTLKGIRYFSQRCDLNERAWHA